MKNIAIIGTIGVGKTTLIQNLKLMLAQKYHVEIMREPSVSVPQVNSALENFYKYGGKEWAYSLQLGISASQVINFQELKNKEYDFLLADMPYSSYLYGNIHLKNGVFDEKDVKDVCDCYRPFHFDYVILLKASKEETEKRVAIRNQASKEGKIKDQLDLEINDFSYLDTHIRDFNSVIDGFLNRYFSDSKVIRKEVPDMLSVEYVNMINEIMKEIEK